jgi:uncharacterized protein YdgA (DUF945 family)
VASFDLAGKETSGRILLPRVSLESQEGQVVLKEILLNANHRVGTGGLPMGATTLKIGSCMSTTRRQSAIKAIAFSAEANERNGLVTLSLKLSATDIVADGERFGPVVLAIKADNLHAPTLAAFKKELVGMEPGGPAASTAQEKKLDGFVTGLLTYEPGIAIEECVVATPKGTFILKAQVRMAKAPVDTELTPEVLRKLVQCDATITAPTPFIENLCAAKEPDDRKAAIARLFKNRGSSCELNVVMRDEILSINGKKMTPEMLLPLLMGGGGTDAE